MDARVYFKGTQQDKIVNTTFVLLNNTDGPRLSQILWEHENLSGLNVMQLIQLL